MRLKLYHMTVIAALSVLYGGVGLLNAIFTSPHRYVDVATWFDQQIHFQAGFIWPYLFYYFLLFAPLFFPLPIDELHRLWKRLAWASFLAAVMFTLLPTQPDRADATLLQSGLSAWVVELIYHIDPPANCFPSLHVLHSVLVALAYLKTRAIGWSGRMGVAFAWMAIGVSFATVFIKQHYFADVVAAYFMVPVVVWFSALQWGRVRQKISSIIWNE